MSVTRVLLILALAAPAASAAELKTLKGEIIKGDLVSVSDKAVVLNAGGKEISTPIDDVLLVSLKDGYDNVADVKYAEVELTDGSLLRCTRVEMKGKDVALTLLQGQEVHLPIAKLAWILNEGHVEQNRKDWKERVLAKKNVRDVVALKRKGVMNGIAGTFADTAEDNGKLAFNQKDGPRRIISPGAVAGLFFQRNPDPRARPVLCKFHDAAHNLLFASAVARTADGYTVTTSSGATIKIATDKVVKMDFSKGKLTYLADINPLSVKESSTEDVVQHYHRNENLDGKDIRMAGTVYKSGLALHSTTELEYDLDGEYREFKAVVGIDDDVSGDDAPTILKIEGDGNMLLTLTISRKDKQRSQPVALNIKDVKKLKITVTHRDEDLLDLGKHLTLADARVSK